MSTGESIFFFNDTATTEIYTLSLHDALPISPAQPAQVRDHIAHARIVDADSPRNPRLANRRIGERSEEHTSELQSQSNLVCRLLLEKKTRLERSYDVHISPLPPLPLQ